jgi:tetratricopeptide (TPR) repeat protein
LPLEVVADIAVGAMAFRVEGSDAAGYRIDAVDSSFSDENRFRLFVVKEDGRYRIVANNTAPNLIGMEALRRVEAGDLNGAKAWLDWARDEISPRKDGDPLAEEPFLLVWEKESGAGPDRIRLAAACLLSETRYKQVIPILLKCREAADQASRTAIDLALGRAYLEEKRYPELLVVCDRLGRSYPLSATLFLWRETGFRAMKRWSDVKAQAEDRLRRIPKDTTAIRVLASCAEQNGDFEQAEKWYKTLVAEGTAKAGDYNNLAWLAMFGKSVPSESLSFAERAVSLSGGEKGGALHTLSALYAETGKSAEAREMILKAISTTDRKVPESPHWFVFGRIAEQYGELEAATEAYGKVTGPDPDSIAATSTYALARKGLLRLRK